MNFLDSTQEQGFGDGIHVFDKVPLTLTELDSHGDDETLSPEFQSVADELAANPERFAPAGTYFGNGPESGQAVVTKDGVTLITGKENIITPEEEPSPEAIEIIEEKQPVDDILPTDYNSGAFVYSKMPDGKYIMCICTDD